MSKSVTLILDQALELSATERADVSEKLLLVWIVLTQKLMPFGQKKLMHVLRLTKRVKLKQYLQKMSLLNTANLESHFS